MVMLTLAKIDYTAMAQQTDLRSPSKQALIRRTFGLLCRKQSLGLVQKLPGLVLLVVGDGI